MDHDRISQKHMKAFFKYKLCPDTTPSGPAPALTFHLTLFTSISVIHAFVSPYFLSTHCLNVYHKLHRSMNATSVKSARALKGSGQAGDRKGELMSADEPNQVSFSDRNGQLPHSFISQALKERGFLCVLACSEAFLLLWV